MVAWVKMAVAVMLLVMPGGLLFLFGLALGRAFAARVRTGRVPRSSWLQAARAVSVRDVWRETRSVAGLPPAAAAGH